MSIFLNVKKGNYLLSKNRASEQRLNNLGSLMSEELGVLQNTIILVQAGREDFLFGKCFDRI